MVVASGLAKASGLVEPPKEGIGLAQIALMHKKLGACAQEISSLEMNEAAVACLSLERLEAMRTAATHAQVQWGEHLSEGLSLKSNQLEQKVEALKTELDNIDWENEKEMISKLRAAVGC